MRWNLWLSRRPLTSAAVLVSLALVGTVPFNMGGCSMNDPSSIVNMVQGGGKIVQSQSLSDKDEEDMGQSVAIAVTSKYGVYDDAKLNHYVNLVGTTVASASPRADLRFYFCVLDTDEVNAFSGPNGYVMVTRGAVANCHNEAELAGLLGHEIGHIVKQHGLNAVKNAGLLNGAMQMAKSDNTVAQLGQLSDAAADAVLKTGFDQPQEIEADQAGVRFVIAAGYDPNAYLAFMQRLQAERGAGHSNVFSTHPGLDARISKVSDQIAKSGKGGTGATLADRFAKNVTLKS